MESGALPELVVLPNDETKRNYISAIKDTVLLRDIIQRHNIKEPKLLEDIFVYLVNNASNLISIPNNFQSTYLSSDEQTVRREYAPLETIKDNFEKLVVSLYCATLIVKIKSVMFFINPSVNGKEELLYVAIFALLSPSTILKI
jgi:predicted AAA+ superfamily ATPase